MTLNPNFRRMIIERIPIDNNAFVFGLNTFIALVIQTFLSILVTKTHYLNDIRRQAFLIIRDCRLISLI